MQTQACQEMAAGTEQIPEWVDSYFARIRPYVCVRLEDNLLIKLPNVACALNASGARIVKALLDGEPVRRVLQRLPAGAGSTRETLNFLFAVRHYLEGRLNEFCINPAVERRVHPLVLSTLPVLGEFALTYQCNLRCAFCYLDGAAQGGAMLTEREQKRIITIMAEDARLPSLSFTGGEPLLVAHLPELVRHAKGLGMRVNVITNGTLADARLARRLARAGVDSAQVSIEGVTAATHDRLVGVPGSFARSVAALKHLQDAGIYAHGNTTVTRANYDECMRMPQFVREQLGGARFSMNMLIPTGRGEAARELHVRYREIGALVAAVQAESRRHGVEFMWYAPLPLCIYNTIAAGLGARSCGACDGLLSVAPNGDVLPCSSCAEAAGNVLRQTFAEVWSSPRAHAYRHKEYAPPRCRTCPHLHLCNGACTLYWRALGCDELKLPDEERT